MSIALSSLALPLDAGSVSAVLRALEDFCGSCAKDGMKIAIGAERERKKFGSFRLRVQRRVNHARVEKQLGVFRA
jgi:hypothetical protein